MNPASYILFAGQILVKSHPRDAGRNVRAHDNEDEVPVAREVWPNKDTEEDVVDQNEEEATPRCEAALERRAGGGRRCRGNVIVFFKLVVHHDNVFGEGLRFVCVARKGVEAVVWEGKRPNSLACAMQQPCNQSGRGNEFREYCVTSCLRDNQQPSPNSIAKTPNTVAGRIARHKTIMIDQ
jgi:hypothetical protein